MQEDVARSWLQDPLKRKLVDFAWNRRFFYLPGACSPFFGYTRLIVLINPIFLSGAPVLINHPVSLGLTRGNRKGGGGAKKTKNRGVFFWGHLAPKQKGGAWGGAFLL